MQRNSDLKAAAACAPHELPIPIALRLGRDISAQLAAVQGDLDLFNQRVGDAGVTAIATHLAANKTVTSLDLYGNRVTDAGAAALVTLLEANASIVRIGLGGANEVGDEARARIATLCEVRVRAKPCLWMPKEDSPSGWDAETG